MTPSEDTASLYFNENVEIPVADNLKKAGFDVLTTRDAHMDNAKIDDCEQLDFAIKMNRIMVTHNRRHFRRLHKQYQDASTRHHGIILLKVREIDVLTKCIADFLSNLNNWKDKNFCELLPKDD